MFNDVLWEAFEKDVIFHLTWVGHFLKNIFEKIKSAQIMVKYPKKKYIIFFHVKGGQDHKWKIPLLFGRLP